MNFHCTEYGFVIWDTLFAVKSHDGRFIPDLIYINKTFANGVCVPCTSDHIGPLVILIILSMVSLIIMLVSLILGINWLIIHFKKPIPVPILTAKQIIDQKQHLLIIVEKKLIKITKKNEMFLRNASKKIRKRYKKNLKLVEECPICMDCQINIEIVPCNHKFCFNCVKRYNDICACCRGEVIWINVTTKIATKN